MSETQLKEKIVEILEDFDNGYAPNSGREGMYHWRDQILEALKDTDHQEILDQLHYLREDVSEIKK